MASLYWLLRLGAPVAASSRGTLELKRAPAYSRDAASAPRNIKLIVGLGNPGARFARSRHNVGFMVADRFVLIHRLQFGRKRFNARIAEGDILGKRVIIAKPQTYMNSSGEAVGKLLKFYRIAPHDLLVVYDDLDLPLGKMRLRPRGSAGGHHGMESIIARIGTSDFPRLRVGISRPDPDADIDHVLGSFIGDERKVIDDTCVRTVEAMEVWLAEGISAAMNRFN